MHSLAEKTLWTVFANDMPMVTMYNNPDAVALIDKLDEVEAKIYQRTEGRVLICWNAQSSKNFGPPYEEIEMSRSEMDHLFQFCIKKVGYNQFQHILDGDQNSHSDWGLM